MDSRSTLNWLKSRIFCQLIYCLICLTILQVIGEKVSDSKYYLTESFNEQVINSTVIKND